MMTESTTNRTKITHVATPQFNQQNQSNGRKFVSQVPTEKQNIPLGLWVFLLISLDAFGFVASSILLEPF